jgi:hypothetical protein
MRYEQLEKYLDDDLAWRRVEISELLLLAKNTEKEVLLKSLILLLYAHWEGFIKKSSKLYIQFISEEKVKVAELAHNFRAVALKEKISRCIVSSEQMTLANEISFLNSYLKLDHKKFKVSIDVDNDFDKSIIDTESNLKPKVFKNIISVLGLNYKTALAAREHYINSQLLANRNAIGHGSKFDPGKQNDFELTVRDVEKLKNIIFSIIDSFKEELLEYTYNKYYLISNETARLKFEQKREEELEKVIAAIETSFRA